MNAYRTMEKRSVTASFGSLDDGQEAMEGLLFTMILGFVLMHFDFYLVLIPVSAYFDSDPNLFAPFRRRAYFPGWLKEGECSCRQSRWLNRQAGAYVPNWLRPRTRGDAPLCAKQRRYRNHHYHQARNDGDADRGKKYGFAAPCCTCQQYPSRTRCRDAPVKRSVHVCQSM